MKPSLLCAEPIFFSPLYLNTKNISTEKLLALYRTANLFFSKTDNVMNKILDMEKHSEKLSVDCSPIERHKLIHETKGLSIDFQCILKNEGQKMMEISVHIVPGEVLKRAQQGKSELIPQQMLVDNLGKLVIMLILKEIRRRFFYKVMDCFKTFGKNLQELSLITQLLKKGRINSGRNLLKEASIDDFRTWKYRDQFEQLMSKELLPEGMQVRETIKTCFKIGQDNDYSLIRDAKKRQALLEITIRETKKDKINNATKV
jgi:hypothetical protein